MLDPGIVNVFKSPLDSETQVTVTAYYFPQFQYLPPKLKFGLVLGKFHETVLLWQSGWKTPESNYLKSSHHYAWIISQWSILDCNFLDSLNIINRMPFIVDFWNYMSDRNGIKCSIFTFTSSFSFKDPFFKIEV